MRWAEGRDPQEVCLDKDLSLGEFQEVGGEKRYVDFAAKAFNKAQQNYGAAKRELLAGLFAMARWRPWLLYRRFTWGMDLKAMTFINSSTNQMVLDWINLFMEFDFVTKFKKGVLNVLPHELSHCYDLLELDFGRDSREKNSLYLKLSKNTKERT